MVRIGGWCSYGGRCHGMEDTPLHRYNLIIIGPREFSSGVDSSGDHRNLDTIIFIIILTRYIYQCGHDGPPTLFTQHTVSGGGTANAIAKCLIIM